MIKNRPYPAHPYKQNDLFTGGDNIHLNACVGRNGGPYGLDAYALGYFKGAIRLSESLIKDSSLIDLVIYPLVFNYRHGIELYLKHIGTTLPKLLDERSLVKATHMILDNWETVSKLLERVPECDPDKSLIPSVDKILRDLIEIDPNGEAFRFPHARSGNIFLQDTSLINVEVLATSMNTVFDAFYYWDHLIAEFLDNKYEELADYI